MKKCSYLLQKIYKATNRQGKEAPAHQGTIGRNADQSLEAYQEPASVWTAGVRTGPNDLRTRDSYSGLRHEL